MKVVLSAEIPVHRFALFAEMAWLERRPELGLLCRAARDQGKRMTAETVQSVLPGLQDAGAGNVLAWCAMLGLCDRHGGLTVLGEEVAESDEAPVPEQGVYCLWLVEHALIGRRALAAERLPSTRDSLLASIEPIAIAPDLGKLFASVVDPRERFMVRGLPTNHGQAGCVQGATQATCRLRWTLDFDHSRDQWQLDGKIEVPQGNQKYALRPMQHVPESDGIDLWKLAASWATGPFSSFGRWQDKERRLAVAFRTLAEPEVDSFRKTLPLPRVEIPGKGSYDEVTLEGVPIGPATADDAQQWALARFERHVVAKPAYRSRVEVRTLFAELVEGTPLERLAPTLPAHDELLARAARDTDWFWSLAAPVDLAPRPVAPEELAPLRIGSSPAGQAASVAQPAGRVRIPFRGGWSMRRLVDALLDGAAPRKVLLCDRYVRGEQNLETLKLLVAALRVSGPDLAMEVWTLDEPADLKKVQAITGTPPKSYRDVFGRRVPPHDRYLLVLPRHGQGFGWQMSNSPLDARAAVASPSPETPLGWRDLAATRVTAEELEPELRGWLVGAAR